jgi:hypothetical protein
MKRVKFEIDPKDGVTGVKVMSLVDVPAMQSEFVAMAEEKPQYVEMKLEGYKQVVAGLALIPDKDFLRKTPEGEAYKAYFTKESIESIRNKFHKEQMTANVNVDHSQHDFIDAYLIESFIIDSPERLADVTAKGIKDGVIGAWFVAYKIEDEKTFKMVLDGKLKGFSVEIFVHKMFKAVVPSELEEVKASVERIEKALKNFTEDGRHIMAVYTPKSKQERRLRLINSKLKLN